MWSASRLGALYVKPAKALSVGAEGLPQGESSAGRSVHILSKFSVLSSLPTSGLKGDGTCNKFM